MVKIYLKELFDTKYFVFSHVQILRIFKELVLKNLAGVEILTAGHEKSNEGLKKIFNAGVCVIDTASCSATSEAWAAIHNLAEKGKIILVDTEDKSVDLLYEENRRKESLDIELTHLEEFSNLSELLSNLKKIKPTDNSGNVIHYGIFKGNYDNNTLISACIIALLFRRDCTFVFDSKWNDIFKVIYRHTSTMYLTRTNNGYIFKEFLYSMNNGFHSATLNDSGRLQFPGLAPMTLEQASNYSYIVPKSIFSKDLTMFKQVEKLFTLCQKDIISFSNRPKKKKLLEEIST